jgi:glycosyltransferase involved in cell wall biosynthesis
MPEKIKILHLGKFYSPYFGGIERCIDTIMKSNLFSKKIYSTLLVFGKVTKALSKKNNKIFIFKEAFNIFSQPISFKYFWFAIGQFKKHEVIHIHYPNILASLVCIFIPRTKKIIVHWHSDIINTHGLSLIIRILENNMLRRTQHIIVATEIYAKNSNALLAFKNKITYIPYGINKQNLLKEPTKSKFYKKIFNQFKNKKIILSVGRLISYKCFDEFISIANLLHKDYIILIVGNGPLHNKLNMEIKKNNLEEKIKILPNVNNKKLEIIYKSSYLYVSLSKGRQESFGISLIEAQKYSLPIITNNPIDTGAHFINIHNITGYNLKKTNSKILARNINSLLVNKSKYDSFKKASYESFIERFQEDDMVNNINNLYLD